MGSRADTGSIGLGDGPKYPLGVACWPSAEAAMAIDQAAQDVTLQRPAVIEGQLRGLRRMIEERQHCIDNLTQISAIHEALRGVGRVVVRRRLETCVTESLQGRERQRRHDELMDLVHTFST